MPDLLNPDGQHDNDGPKSPSHVDADANVSEANVAGDAPSAALHHVMPHGYESIDEILAHTSAGVQYSPTTEDEIRAVAEEESELAFPPSDPPEFPDALLEDGLSAAAPGSGVPLRAASAMMTPVEREAQLKQYLDEQKLKAADERNLILETGPLALVERRLRDMVRDTTDADIGEVIMLNVRKLVHEAVVSNPMIREKESTEAGLMARIDVMQGLEAGLEDKLAPFFAGLEAQGVNIHKVRGGVVSVMNAEQKRLEQMKESLMPATLGSRIFDGLGDLKNSVTGAFKNKELVGDLRAHRNAELTRALSDLGEVSFELRNRAGDAEWERGDGAKAVELANGLVDSIQNLTHGVEDQVDHNSLNRGLNDAKENIAEAAAAAADEEHKGRLARMVESIRRAVENIIAAVAKALGMKKDGAEANNTTKFTPA